MAKFYCKKDNKIYWDENGLYSQLEEDYYELTDFIAGKKLDGHDSRDQWYMKVQLKMGELLNAMDECPHDYDKYEDQELH